MLRRNGIGASTSLAPVAHAEDAQPNEVSKKRKGQGLPPIVASSKPPARTSYNHRGRGGATIRGGYRGRKGADMDASTQYAIRGGKANRREHQNPSSWPRRADRAFPSPQDPSSNSRRALSVAIPPTPPTAGQTGIDKGRAPIRGGDQSMNKSWHRRDNVTTHRNTPQEKRASPWGHQPDSGYAQRAIPRPTTPPKVDGPSQAPLPYRNSLHPSLPSKPPPQSAPQSPPQFSSSIFQSGPQSSRAPAVTEWYMRIGSPDPKLPPEALARKNAQAQSTISMPLPGRLRKFQEKRGARGAAENSPPAPSQPGPIASLPVASPVHQKPQPKPELSQVPLPPDIPKGPLPKRLTAEPVRTVKKPPTETPPFVAPEVESNVYKPVSLSEQRKSHSRPRDVPTDSPLLVPPQDESAPYRSQTLPQQSKPPPQPHCNIKPPTSTSTTTASPPTSLEPRPQPAGHSKSAVSPATKSPEMDALSFAPPQGSSSAYVPVPLSLQRQSRIPLYTIPPTPEPEAEALPLIPPQEASIARVPASLSQRSDLSNFSMPQSRATADPMDSSRDSSRMLAQSMPMKTQRRVPERKLRPQIEAERDDALKSDAVSSASPSLPPIETLQHTRKIEAAPLRSGFTAPPPSEAPPATVGAPPATPAKMARAVGTGTQTVTMASAHSSPDVVVKQEGEMSPLSRSPVKPARKLVTEAASFYPMPAACDKAVPAYKENRKAFFKDNSRTLSALGLKRTKAFFRDDGLVIEWKSDVPVWSDTLQPEENNLATAMEEFLVKQSAGRSDRKRKRNERDALDGREPSPGAKRIKSSTQAELLPPSNKKRKIADSPDTFSSERKRKSAAAGHSTSSSGLWESTSSSSRTYERLPITTNRPLGASSGDAAASKDEPIYIFSSPESSPKPTSKPLPSATSTPTKVPLPTRLHLAKTPIGALAHAPSTSTSTSNSNFNSRASMSTDAVPSGGRDNGADFDSEGVELSGRTSIDPIEIDPSAAPQTGAHAYASGPPPSSRRMVFKPTNPPRTARVTPAAYVSASAPSAEERGIGQHTIGATHITDSNSVRAPTLPGRNPDAPSTSSAYSPIVPNDALDLLLPAQKEVRSGDSAAHGGANGSTNLNKPLIMETAMGTIEDAEDITNQVLKDDDSDIYCSERDDVQEDDEEEDDESKLAVDFFTRFITFFDSDRSKLASAYAKNALFTCRVHDLRPRSSTMAEHFAPESKLVFQSAHSNASASTVEHGRSRICDRLRAMGPHKFRALPGSVVWDLAPLPLDSPGHLMFSVHGEVVDPSHAGRHLDHILTVDQTFVLRPRTHDDNTCKEDVLSDSLRDDEEWPLVAISHQMTVRESRLLPLDAIENLLPWVADIGS